MKILIVILGMAIVTYIPRVLPVFIINRISVPKWLERFLSSIPYAALGALIFPGVLTTVKDVPIIGLIAGVITAVLAYLRVHIIFCILASILSVMILRLVI